MATNDPSTAVVLRTRFPSTTARDQSAEVRFRRSAHEFQLWPLMALYARTLPGLSARNAGDYVFDANGKTKQPGEPIIADGLCL
jgi:hypothetical protein